MGRRIGGGHKCKSLRAGKAAAFPQMLVQMDIKQPLLQLVDVLPTAMMNNEERIGIISGSNRVLIQFIEFRVV